MESMQEKQYRFIISGKTFILSNLDIWIGYDHRYNVWGTKKTKKYIDADAPYELRKYLNELFDRISECTEHSEKVFFDYLNTNH